MMFWTIVSFVLYSIVYFVVSQRKMNRLKKTILQLRRQNILEKNVRPTRVRQN